MSMPQILQQLGGAKHGEPPADMLAVYNYVHKHEMNKESSVRVMQSMFRG